MKVICLRKSINQGALKLVRDQVSDVPDPIAKDWIAAGYVKEVTEADAAQASQPSTTAKTGPRRSRS